MATKLTTAQVKSKIKRSPHKTISQFARATGRDRYDLQKLFALKQPPQGALQAIIADLNSGVVELGLDEITPDKRKELASALSGYGGVTKFVQDNPGFARSSVNQILSGHRKKMTPKAKEIFDFFRL